MDSGQRSFQMFEEKLPLKPTNSYSARRLCPRRKNWHVCAFFHSP